MTATCAGGNDANRAANRAALWWRGVFGCWRLAVVIVFLFLLAGAATYFGSEPSFESSVTIKVGRILSPVTGRVQEIEKRSSLNSWIHQRFVSKMIRDPSVVGYRIDQVRHDGRFYLALVVTGRNREVPAELVRSFIREILHRHEMLHEAQRIDLDERLEAIAACFAREREGRYCALDVGGRLVTTTGLYEQARRQLLQFLEKLDRVAHVAEPTMVFHRRIGRSERERPYLVNYLYASLLLGILWAIFVSGLRRSRAPGAAS